VREFWFEGEDVRLYAVEDGNGPVIVMLHGGMANHLAALPLIAPLSPRYRVVAPDLRGSGRSLSAAPLSFARLGRDIELLLDHLGAKRAVVGGISSGSGIALCFALRHPDRTAGLVVVKPIYAGTERGYSAEQKATFTMMDAVAGRALAEGVQALRPLYANLPPATRDKALAMLEGFDAASVLATSHFIASGAQPFASGADLRALRVPTLLVRGDDVMHPAEVADLYAANIPNCTVAEASTTDIAAAIGAFCEQCIHGCE
jgi:pimeloyl-ACP methyl ester carboxylesterase